MTIQIPSAVDKYVRRSAPAVSESFEAPTDSPMVRPNANPTPAPEPTVKTGLDTNISTYLDKTAENLGKPTYMTEAGQLHADRVTNALKTPDASSVNAQNTEDTAAARRAYLARYNAGEALGQSGFVPGSAQATRIMDQSQAGVNAANQAGQNAVNAYIRQRTEDNMRAARDLEDTQQYQNQNNLRNVQDQSDRVYGRGRDAQEFAYRAERDAVGDARYTDETTYRREQDAITRADNLDQRNWERERVIKGDDERAKQSLLQNLPDGPAKNVATRMLAEGKSQTEVLAAIFNPDGSIKPEYRGKTTAELGLDAQREYAIQTLTLEDPSFDPNTPEGVRAVAAKVLEMRKAKDNPITDDTKARSLEDASARLASLKPGEKPNPDDLALLPSVTAQSIPQGSATASWLADSQTGGWVRIGGTPYKVVGGDSYVTRKGDGMFTSDLHDDYVIMQDANGHYAYITDTGKIVRDRPKKGWESTQK